MDESLVSGIRVRYLKTLNRIAEATTRSGREVGKVRLVVVTKSQPLEVVQAAVTAGAIILGENYAEEALTKIAAIRNSQVEWHMIGHVQSRKADLIPGNFSLLHSLDSLKLAGRLNRVCVETNRKLPVLLEVNVSREESKFGFPGWDEGRWLELVSMSKQIIEFPGLLLRGLMTMPPFFTEPAEVRPYFQRLRRLEGYLKEHVPQVDWSELSMGTSGDFEIAVEEGATIVRVGQAILGPRPG
ncbi:MAG: YggS family pyridoxal phosphate-dependent enzyme [Anaerolineales bacterium]|jgi:pyridoxal phosphate enzyme (YggS family)